ncbi:hypothetical protein ACTGZQ_00820 [Streptococcus suis]
MKLSKWKLIIAVILVIGGIIIFHQYQQHQEELKRNREYEVSLVNTLKNTYEGIKEIRIKKPKYNSKPSNWHCEITMIFEDKRQVSYGASYEKDTGFISEGGLKRQQTTENWEYLQQHKGTTTEKIKIKYSDGEEQIE